MTDRVRFGAPRSVAPPIQLIGNAKTNGSEPWHEVERFSAVGKYADLIDRVAGEKGIDPRLIRAIMYKETVSGYYDRLFEIFDWNKSILPMNVNQRYWGDVFGSRDELKIPENNIRAGAEMLSRIMANLLHGASVAEIATLYQNSRATEISKYGLRVQTIYNEQPWLRNAAEVPHGSEIRRDWDALQELSQP